MSTLSLSLHPYSLALRRPLRVAAQQLAVREGLVLTLCDADGRTGYGDVAPLPGLHTETLASARAWLEGFVLPEDGGVSALRRQISNEQFQAPPSAWFALEAAFVWLEAQRRGCSPAWVLSEAPLDRVPVNALFEGDAAAAEAALDGGAFDAYPSVKVKLGRRAPPEERRMLQVLLEGLDPAIRLRLDANRGLSLECAVDLLAGLPVERIEYVEEPVSESQALEAFHARTGLPIALDETLASSDAAALVRLPGVRALVLKPALRGGVLETLADAERAERMGKDVVISSCFESGLGLTFLAQLAAAVMQPGVAAGLATDRWLAQDVVVPAFDTSQGRIEIAAWDPSPLGSTER